MIEQKLCGTGAVVREGERELHTAGFEDRGRAHEPRNAACLWNPEKKTHSHRASTSNLNYLGAHQEPPC